MCYFNRYAHEKQNCPIIAFTIHIDNGNCIRKAVCTDCHPAYGRYKIIPGCLSVYGTEKGTSFLENNTFLTDNARNAVAVYFKELN